MNNNYLIPANSKKSQLILGFLTVIDLIIFISGCVITLILLLLVSSPTFTEIILILIPLLVSAFLILPIQYYHNMLQLLMNIVGYFNNRRHYFWKGWCVTDESEVK